MTNLTMTSALQVTLVENAFIDTHMPKANGEYVKVYLLLLRYLNDPAMELSVSKIADILDCTEKDVLRALNYWKKQGLLDFESRHADRKPALSEAVDSVGREKAEALEDTVPVLKEKTAVRRKPNLSKSRKELKELLFVAEQYLGKTLTATDIDTIIYFHDELGMSASLIEYLIEYCVENGHKSIHYIKTVALSWSEKDIKTIEAAKMNTVMYNKNYYSILNAYGIKGRAPASSEITYIRRWLNDYKLSLDLILEACDRTMNMIHQPSFEYTERILKNWMEKGAAHLKDVTALDEAYLKQKESKKAESKNKIQPLNPVHKNTKNKFNNFEGRTYADMDELSRKLITQ